MNLRTRYLLGALGVGALAACATPTVVQTVKPGDNGLSCAQLQNEYADAERLRTAADAEKSVTGGNVVRALFFWPAILGTAANANEAIAAADTRKVGLSNLMNQKNCSIPSSVQPVDVVRAAEPASQSQETRLVDLKKLFDASLISREVYAERQKVILATP